MEEKELNEIIKLEQLPIITQQLDTISKDIEERVSNALKLDCNEETVKQIKQVRADFNKEFKILEDKRKQVKSAIMEKYDKFEEVYKEKISNLYKNADTTLKEKIDNVENDLKVEKEIELREFFNEHCISKGIDGLFTFDSFNYPITLSASMKSLKEKVLQDLESVEQAIKLIELEEFSDEILFEYKQNRDFSKSKLDVIERHKQLEEIKKQQEQKQEVEKQEEKIEEVVEEIIAPVEVKSEEEIKTYQFEVKATDEQIKKLIEFMKELGVEYK